MTHANLTASLLNSRTPYSANNLSRSIGGPFAIERWEILLEGNRIRVVENMPAHVVVDYVADLNAAYQRGAADRIVDDKFAVHA
jgi:hypothetical protein